MPDMKYEPAYTIIKFLGGAYRVARLLRLHPSAVYKWTLPEEKTGASGRIPSRRQKPLLDYCKENGIDLRADDFFDPSRLQQLLADKKGGKK